MFSGLRRLIGLIKVTESGNQIHISGIPGDAVARDITAIWETSKLVSNIFSHVGKSDVSFNKFFAPDIVYAFQRIIRDKKKGHNIRALKRIVEQMYEFTWLKSTKEKHPDIIHLDQMSKMNVTLAEHQQNFLEMYNVVKPAYQLKGMLAAAGPGTGKTIMACAWSICLKTNATVCVVPKNAVYRVWADTFKERFKQTPKYWTSLDGIDPVPGQRFYVVHFAYLDKFNQWLRSHHLTNVNIVLDESHNVNDIESLRAEQFIQLCQLTNSQDVLWMSGTPIKALGGETAPLFKTIDPFFDADAQMRFKAIYGKASGRANDILAARIGRISFKISSDAVVEGNKPIHTAKRVKLPSGEKYTLNAIRAEMKKFITERIEYYKKNMRSYESQYNAILSKFERTLITREQKQQYETYRRYIKMIRKGYDPVALKEEAQFCNHYEKHVIMSTLTSEEKKLFKDIKSVIKYYLLKVQGEALGKVLGKKRAECIAEMIPYIEMDTIIDYAIKKTVIFTSYVLVVQEADKYLKNHGYQPILIFQETNSQLPSLVSKFETDPDANPLIATYLSLSAAVPLVMANQMIMLNPPFRSYEYEQAVARTYRKGQDEQVYVTDVYLDTGEEPNISTRSKDIMDWSKKMVAEIMQMPVVGNPALESYHEDCFDKESDWVKESLALEERPSFMNWY